MKDFTKFGFIRVATAVPQTVLGDARANANEIIQLYSKASRGGASVVVFPELSLTGYTIADLVAQKLILRQALEQLARVAKSTNTKTAMVVGIPLQAGNKLYNAAAVLAGGKILGIVAKTFLPNYQEFYEARWYASANELAQSEITIATQKVPIGNDLLFRLGDYGDAILGVEICEDLWAPIPPSSQMAVAGANIIANLSASNELVAKADYRRELIAQQSARTRSAYLYTSVGAHESTTDLVFGGHSVIAENGSLLMESERFGRESALHFADVDLQHLAIDRYRTNTFTIDNPKQFRTIDIPLVQTKLTTLERQLAHNPFVPDDPTTLDRRAAEIIATQATGLATRMQNTGREKIVLGLSGGLDSTLALLVAVEAFRMLGRQGKNKNKDIITITMPGFATGKRTKNNAVELAQKLGTTLEEIPISVGATDLLKAIGHNTKTQDPTYENAQARYRTLILMSRSNQLNALVLGTGDLSEIALGWCTFNGDHISHYNVNASIPKTLVKHLVSWFANQPENKAAQKTLLDIVDTPISPELTDAQSTEELIGPYELHDFFIYHFVRWGSEPRKIFALAQHAFGKKYSRAVILKYLKLFLTRFFASQWKRSVASDGPKVGSVSLSPRGDWRMPSDASAQAWLRDLDSV